MGLVRNQIKIFLVESTSILKEQINFLSQLIRKPIKYPSDSITHNFFSELHIQSLSKRPMPDKNTTQEYINKILTINNLPADNFLIKQFRVLLNIHYHRITLTLDLYTKKYGDMDNKEKMVKVLKSELEKYITPRSSDDNQQKASF